MELIKKKRKERKKSNEIPVKSKLKNKLLIQLYNSYTTAKIFQT